MSDAFEDIIKAIKAIHASAGTSPHTIDATLKAFSEMGIDAKKDG